MSTTHLATKQFQETTVALQVASIGLGGCQQASGNTPAELRKLRRKTRMRVIDFPVRDYSAQTFRLTLDSALNEDACTSVVPEGSGSRYVVFGDDAEIKVRLVETTVRADKFMILPEAFFFARA